MRSNVVCLFYVVLFSYRVLFANQRGISIIQCGESYRSERPCFLSLRLLWRARFLEFSRRGVVVSLLPCFVMFRSLSAMASTLYWVGSNVAWSTVCCYALCGKCDFMNCLDVVWLSVYCHASSCSGHRLLWRVRFIQLNLTWRGHLFAAVLYCVLVFFCCGKRLSLSSV